jgi:superfamily II DNA or RNA helicase
MKVLKMIKLENLKQSSYVRGLEGSEVVQIKSIEPVSIDAVTVLYKNAQGQFREQMIHRNDESRLELVENSARPWSFEAEGTEFRIGLEAQRIRLAHLFDPMMAVHSSNVEPLPHQITAVYESMLPRQPLRFVLADDPGAGKTIMAGLFIKELVMRADAKRVLIVTPGSLSEQWQEELYEKFGLRFELFSREKMEQSVRGNYFEEQDFLICRLDQLSRNEDFLTKLEATEWDLVIVDEAHKMSASFSGGEVKRTERFLLGEKLGRITRHLLLMTATPHNGKEEDFQLWLSLLDSDRFYGKFRDGVHKVDVTDIMRRMVKEELRRFDGTKLFPPRFAYTVNYALSNGEQELYEAVTTYVREEMDRADKLDKKRGGTVGFALTSLQRRLASSPAAIHESLKRRLNKLQIRLEETKKVSRGQLGADALEKYDQNIPSNFDDADDEMNSEEYEAFTDEVMDQATAAQTVEELQKEIIILKSLEQEARKVRQSGEDKKWSELSTLLQGNPNMRDEKGNFRKMLIFTESRDTLEYLVERIAGVFGSHDNIVTIHGGTSRDLRKKAQADFRNDSKIHVLIATDAAGEGVNLQNANLMVNYDLPWNPNRIEQRFGRIHRIGQTQVCHLWNMVAKGTREGDVFQTLCEKLEVQSKALGGRVFDILGEAFEEVSLRDLLLQAIRKGDSKAVRDEIRKAVSDIFETERIQTLYKRNALVEQHMGLEQLYKVKEDMDRAEARKLQPYFIRSFFEEAFKTLGGDIRPRETGRWEISHVPAIVIERAKQLLGSRHPVTRTYQRVCFEKNVVPIEDRPKVDLIHPGHPLMAAVTDIILEKNRSKLREGAILVDPSDDSVEPRVVFMLEHSIKESSGEQKSVSQVLQFVSIDKNLNTTNAGWAPHIDLRSIKAEEKILISDVVNAPWIKTDLENKALSYASQELAPQHFREAKGRRELYADKVKQAVHERLTKEISYWEDRYLKLKEALAEGKQPRMQPENARRKVEDLSARLEQRKREIAIMRNVISSTPNVIGGALIIPAGLLALKSGNTNFTVDAEARKRIEMIAMNAVISTERSFGHHVFDVSSDKCGWDITARVPPVGDIIFDDRHIEVKGRAKGQETITVTANEIMYALNQREKFILAVVIVDGENFEGPYYIKNPFKSPPDFQSESRNVPLKELLKMAVSPESTLVTK